MLDIILATTIQLYGDQNGLWSPSHCEVSHLPCSMEDRAPRPEPLSLETEPDAGKPETDDPNMVRRLHVEVRT